jgi:hypothetical protein
MDLDSALLMIPAASPRESTGRLAVLPEDEAHAHRRSGVQHSSRCLK